MSFDGIRGICDASLGLLDAAGDESVCRLEAMLALLWDVCLCAPSGVSVGRGGGYGDIDIDVTEAECAWYTLMDWNIGS